MVTDGGHYILDCHLGSIGTPDCLARRPTKFRQCRAWIILGIVTSCAS